MTVLTKCFTNKKKQHTSLKLLFKVNSKFSEENFEQDNFEQYVLLT